MSENREENSSEITKRPDGLTILCILSFIGSGLALISNLYIFLLYSSIPELLQSEDVLKIPSMDPEIMLQLIQSTTRSFFFFSSSLYAASVFGVYLMWHLRKKGIHVYAIAQFLILIVSLIYMGGDYAVLPGLLMTLLFVFLYSKYYKLMS